MERRYQVFVSSTYEDLKEERKEVMQALLELDCIPCGMELFPAADEDQWTLIKRVIDDSDYYILIMAGKYGSLNSDGMSYTEMEYRYALEKKKPIIAFVHANIDDLASKKVELDENKKIKLNKFKELVEKKVRKTWSSPAELGSVVSRGMVNLIKTHPTEGWVKAGNILTEDLAKEILELRHENDILKLKLSSEIIEKPEGIEKFSQGDEEVIINVPYLIFNEKRIKVKKNIMISVTWNEIYKIVAPYLLNEDTETNMKIVIYNYLIAEAAEVLKEKNSKIEFEKMYKSEMDDYEFQKIKVQFKVLGLITKSIKQRSVKDTENYWKLTEYGDFIMTQLIAIKSASN